MNSTTAQRVTPLREPALNTSEGILLVYREQAILTVLSMGVSRGVYRVLTDCARVSPAPSGGYLPEDTQPESAFEQWLIERWLREVRSEAFTASVQGQRLITEWERGR